ncbi:MAG: undecaprenyldiphospho-muramoylpentapeptide beta-N-acetylglucosaminyltransferase [Verrucomicrobia bacterium]|nr:undecaprenyldiphospho-muramoylpentapeptide beta-N-acetylglucosaminyltransferase [Verrucomicrobiota bacterium]
MPLRVAIACGGTGGHIFPGLATARVLRERGHSVTLWLAGRKDIEDTVLAHWDGPMLTVPSQGLPAGFSFKSISSVFKMWRAGMVCRRLMKREKPDVLLGMGSYSSVGPVSAALMLRIPFVLHEANVVPGKAVRLFARSATAIAASFEETRYYLKCGNLILTGMPMREELIAARGERSVRIGDRPFTIVVMGGSRGARSINRIVPQALAQLARGGHNLEVIHLSGVEDRQSVQSAYDESKVSADVRAFEHNMADVYNRADLMICRSGAATCAEVQYFQVPALLVPFPFAAGNHQMENARSLEKHGRADVVAEDDLSVDWLVEYLLRCLQHPERLEKMRQQSGNETDAHAAERLADLILETVSPSETARA